MNDNHPLASAQDGRTTHVRFVPFERRFAYRLAQIRVDVDRLPEIARGLKLFSHNHFNLFAFHDRDHGNRSGAPLRAWAEETFARGGVDLSGGRIDLQCFPRVLGFVFNPLSIYFGYGPDGALRGVIYEVNNTFGETHAYVARTGAGDVHDHETAKLFHVSPLMDVVGDYRFRIGTPDGSLHLTIENMVDGVRQHLASLVTRQRPLTDRWLAGVLISMPLSTLQVVVGIHWQALKLWLRGAKYHSKPALPEESVSLARSVSGPRA
ncbi:MAG: DUF1365 domain-containing protein [Alphaproteobacteria bacterium]|nr:DUF1365 domain-containing protein [Alphaproteobacteria bacterium]